jgi:hypothetical protein
MLLVYIIISINIFFLIGLTYKQLSQLTYSEQYILTADGLPQVNLLIKHISQIFSGFPYSFITIKPLTGNTVASEDFIYPEMSAVIFTAFALQPNFFIIICNKNLNSKVILT